MGRPESRNPRPVCSFTTELLPGLSGPGPGHGYGRPYRLHHSHYYLPEQHQRIAGPKRRNQLGHCPRHSRWAGGECRRLASYIIQWVLHKCTPPSFGEPRQARFSIPYFYGPPPEAQVSPLPKLVSPKDPPRYRAVNWTEFLGIKAKHFNNGLSSIRICTSQTDLVAANGDDSNAEVA